MAYSYTTITVGASVPPTITLPFDYMLTKHIGVTIDGEDFALVSTDWNSTNILSTARMGLVEGNVVRVARITPNDELVVNFQDGADTSEENLDQANLQVLYVLQETIDSLTAQLSLDTTTNEWDAQDLVIKNLGTPVDDTDAATKEYADMVLVATSAAQAAAEAAQAAAEAAQSGSETARGLAEAARDAAEVAQAAAEAAQTLAEKWASEDEDIVVAGGEYSAKHYAAKAAAEVASLDFTPYVRKDTDTTLAAAYTNSFTSGATPTLVRNMGRVVLTADTTFPDLSVPAGEMGMYHWIVTGNYTLDWNAAYTPPETEYDGSGTAALVTLVTDGTLKLITVTNYGV